MDHTTGEPLHNCLIGCVSYRCCLSKGSTAAVSFYREQAEAFNGQPAHTLIEALTSSAVEGKGTGDSWDAGRGRVDRRLV